MNCSEKTRRFAAAAPKYFMSTTPLSRCVSIINKRQTSSDSPSGVGRFVVDSPFRPLEEFHLRTGSLGRTQWLSTRQAAADVLHVAIDVLPELQQTTVQVIQSRFAVTRANQPVLRPLAGSDPLMSSTSLASTFTAKNRLIEAIVRRPKLPTSRLNGLMTSLHLPPLVSCHSTPALAALAGCFG